MTNVVSILDLFSAPFCVHSQAGNSSLQDRQSVIISISRNYEDKHFKKL